MKKRIFSLLMAVCMIFNFMPLPAFATQEGVDLPAVETVVNETTTTENATPPTTGGETATPPTTGGETVTPPATGETTPPVNNEKVCTCNPVIGADEGGHIEGCPCFVADAPTCNCKPIAMPSGLVHTEGCPLFVAPPTEKENLCTCKHKCTAADEQNGIPAVIDPNCPVCNAQGADLALCKGGAAVALMLPSARTAGAWTGNGTSVTDPYEIADVADLQKLATDVNAGNAYRGKFFKLTADIDLSSVTWAPIGSYFGTKFNGTFNGNGHTVNLNINGSATDQGLFGCVDDGGTVKNLGVTGTVSGDSNVSGVVGNNLGTVQNCYNAATISGISTVGGVVGVSQGSVESCYNTGIVSGTNNNIGGIVGTLYAGTLTNCYNTGDVSGDSAVGGVVGVSQGSVESCYNTGIVSGTNCVGGVIGGNKKPVTNCVSLGSSVVKIGNGIEIKFGRIIGEGSTGFTGNKARGDMLVLGAVVNGGATDANGADVKVDNTVAISTVFDSTAFTSTDWAVPASGNLDIGATLPTLVGVGGTQTPKLPVAVKAEIPLEDGVSSLASGETYTVADETQLKKLASLVKTAATPVTGYTVNLKNDITLSATPWETIGIFIDGTESAKSKAFAGTFDGCNFEVKNLTINDNNADYQALFGYIAAAGVVKNLGVTGTITGGQFPGGVVGRNEGTVTNCHNAAIVKGTTGAGGVAGVNFNDNSGNGIIENCYNTGAITGTSGSASGIVGANFSTVKTCYNTGAVNGKLFAGGVVATNNGNSIVQNCYNTGAVTSGMMAGGVVSENNGTVKNSYNTGNVDGRNSVGGVLGVNNDNCTVENCYNTGIVTGDGGRSVAGVVGSNGGHIKYCVSLGSKVAKKGESGTDFGRVAGTNSVGASISESKARGDMLVLGAVVNDDGTTTVGNGFNGATVAVGTSTNQTTVFDSAAFTDVNGWNAISGNLAENAKLPTLNGFTPDGQNPTLPKAESGKTDISNLINFVGETVVYNGSVQPHQPASTSAPGGTFAYTYTAKSGSTLDVSGKPKNVGAYTITATYETATAKGIVSVDFNIIPAPLSITTGTIDVYRHKTLPVLTDALIYTGFVGVETKDVLTGAYEAKYSNPSLNTTVVGEFDIIVAATASETNENYTVTTTNGTLKVWEAKNDGTLTTTEPDSPIKEPVVVAELTAGSGKTLRLVVADLMTSEQNQTNAWLDSHVGSGNPIEAHEVELQISANGTTWSAANGTDLVGGTATAALPLPTNTTMETHNMLVYHFANGADKDPTLVSATYNAKAKSLFVQITSFSPFVVVAVPKSVAKPVAPPAQSNNNNSTTVIDHENNFWISVVALIQGAKKGNVLKIDTGAYTKMPACVMEELRIKGAGMIIKWNGGKNIVIPVGKALGAEKNRDIWTLAQLAEIYGKYTVGNKTNPNTGVESLGIVDNQTGITTPIAGNIVDATTTQGSQTGKYILVMVAGTLVAAVTVFGVCIWARKKKKEEE